MGKSSSWWQKHSKLHVGLLACVLVLFACNSNIFSSKSGIHLPGNIAQSFSQQYPHAKIRSFKNEDQTFVVYFANNNRECDASFSDSGKWIKTITKIKWTSQLPPGIKKAFDNSQYASWNVNSISKCEFPNESCYSLYVNNGNLLDADRHDSFLKSYCLNITDNGTINIQDHQ